MKPPALLLLLLYGLACVAQAEPREGPRAVPEAVNPMTGQSLGAERLTRELELQKLRTLLAQERLKAAAAELDLELLPARRDAERGRLLTTAGVSPPRALPAFARAPELPLRAAPAPLPDPMPVPLLRSTAPQVTGIARIGTEYLAVVERGGDTVFARAGDFVFGQQIGDVRADAVVVNGVRVPRPVVVGRAAVVDRQSGPAVAGGPGLPSPLPPRVAPLPAIPASAAGGVAAVVPPPTGGGTSASPLAGW